MKSSGFLGSVGVAGLVLVLTACGGSSATGEGGNIVATPSEVVSTAAEPSETSAEIVASEEPTQEAEASDEPQADDSLGTMGHPAPIGSTAHIGDWDVTLTKVTENANKIVAKENPFNEKPKAGQQFVMWNVDATYNGSESGTAWSDLTWKVLGSDGNTFTDYCGVIPDSLSDKGETFPGGKVKGNLCVAAESAQLDGATLIVEDPFSFDDGDRTFFSLEEGAAQAVPSSDEPTNEAPVGESEAPQASGALGTMGHPAPIGSTAHIGDWDVTLTKVTENANKIVAKENPFNEKPKAGQQFVMWNVDATYNGSESGTAWSDLTWKVLGSDGNTFTDYCGVIPDSLSDKGETFPGGKVKGNLCVAAESAQLDGATLIVENPFSFDDGDRTFFALR